MGNTGPRNWRTPLAAVERVKVLHLLGAQEATGQLDDIVIVRVHSDRRNIGIDASEEIDLASACGTGRKLLTIWCSDNLSAGYIQHNGGHFDGQTHTDSAKRVSFSDLVISPYQIVIRFRQWHCRHLFSVERHELNDEEWAVIAPLLPTNSRGIQRVNDRRVINGILWRFRTGSSWRDVPRRYGPRTTLYNRFSRWRKAGVWDRHLAAVSRRYDGDLVMIDSSCVRVHQHGVNAKMGALPILTWDVLAAA